jgi:cardiolipin synthase
MPLAVTDIFESTWTWLSQDHWVASLLIGLHLAVQFVLAFRVIMRRRPVGESLAWVLVIFVFPVFGPLTYLLMGELRLGSRRGKRFEQLFPPIGDWLKELNTRFRVNWHEVGEECEPLSRLAELSLGLPTLPGNRYELIGDWQAVFQRLVEDIDAAEKTCHLVFYIWQPGGAAEDVAAALIRAEQRGVTCRVLVDAMGSRTFLRSPIADQLRAAGVEILAALPGGIFRMPFVRFDLRMHRKIVVIDGQIAYTGSLNLVDPRYFKQDADVGQWIDAMMRLEGPAVEALAITFLADWYVESEYELEQLRDTGGAEPQSRVGDCAVQALPSGPAFRTESIEQILVMGIYAAQHELVLTTPYFVPSEAMRMALESAARRGVKVILIVPAKVDSRLVRYASQAFQSDLLRAGVRIAKFKGGLLHTKSVTIDGRMSLFGSLNLDPRSLRLNFEISLAVYDRGFTRELRDLQQSYLDQSELIDLEIWHNRPRSQRVAENCARLFGPLL